MINPQGYIMGEKPKNKNPFWEDGEASDVNRIYLTATVDGNTGTPAVDSSKTISGNDIIFGLAFKNLKGAPGADGSPGTDGFSPTATITQDTDGATISITDKNGTTTARIANGTPGTPGTPGEDGYSPTASIEPITGGFRLTITDENGSHSVDIMNGTNGTDGDDGFSPIATVEQTGDNEITITITDAQGTTSATLTGEAGRPGEPGTPGEPGAPGADGFSPIATVTQTATGAEISVTDKNGTTTATVNNGTPGTPGTPGVSPTARVDQTGDNEATITVTDAQGTTTARLTGQAGTPGTPGADGFSPIATVTQTSSGAEISITDRNGTTTATVNNGTPGTPGQQGTPGVGVPTGGTAGQVLAKVDGTDYNTNWINPPSGGGIKIKKKTVTDPTVRYLTKQQYDVSGAYFLYFNINDLISSDATLCSQIENGNIIYSRLNFTEPWGTSTYRLPHVVGALSVLYTQQLTPTYIFVVHGDAYSSIGSHNKPSVASIDYVVAEFEE